MAQNMFKERIKKGPKGTTKDKKGKSFTLHHAYTQLENDEKWKTRDLLQVPNKKKGKEPMKGKN